LLQAAPGKSEPWIWQALGTVYASAPQQLLKLVASVQASKFAAVSPDPARESDRRQSLFVR
jgi:hypothetical protein